MSEFLFHKVAGLRAYSFIKKRLQHRCFLVNAAKFLRTHILKSTSRRQLDKMIKYHWNEERGPRMYLKMVMKIFPFAKGIKNIVSVALSTKTMYKMLGDHKLPIKVLKKKAFSSGYFLQVGPCPPFRYCMIKKQQNF